MKSLKQYISEALVNKRVYARHLPIEEDFFDTLQNPLLNNLKKFLKRYGPTGYLCTDMDMIFPCENVGEPDCFVQLYISEHNDDISVHILLTKTNEQLSLDDWERSVKVCTYKYYDSKNDIFKLFKKEFKNKFNEIIATLDTVKEGVEQLSDVKVKWHPEEGLFTKDANYIVSYLRKHSEDDTQAMRRLVFYMNRAGEDLTNKTELNKAKKMLEKD